MAEPLGHEKLIVYRKALRFVAVRDALLHKLARRVAACDHLERGAESVLINIAHASSTWSSGERIVYLGYANGSALECAACLDVLVAKALLAANDVFPGKQLLAEVVSMLIAMRKIAEYRVGEDRDLYHTRKGRLFDHEDLDVYQAALQLVAWLEPMLARFSCSADLRTKLDKQTTSIVLNIAEGNGRFPGSDRAKFCETAYKAAIQTAALMDLTTANNAVDARLAEQGRELVRRIASILPALSKVRRHD